MHTNVPTWQAYELMKSTEMKINRKSRNAEIAQWNEGLLQMSGFTIQDDDEHRPTVSDDEEVKPLVSEGENPPENTKGGGSDE